MKKCTNCGIEKPLTDYTKDLSKKDGLRPQCRACRSNQRKSEYSANPAPHRERSKNFRIRNPGYYSEYIKEWALNNGASIVARALAWNKAHPAIRSELSMRRYAGKKKATPKWANLSEIRKFYKLAEAMRQVTGESYDVDHIVPLRGENVCGLHVEFNLQILTSAKNRKKGNKHD